MISYRSRFQIGKPYSQLVKLAPVNTTLVSRVDVAINTEEPQAQEIKAKGWRAESYDPYTDVGSHISPDRNSSAIISNSYG